MKKYFLMILVFVLVLVGLTLNNSAMAFTTSQLIPMGNGNYSGWSNSDYNRINEGMTYPSCTMVRNVTDYISTSINNNRSSFKINLSSVPNGSMITDIKVLVADKSATPGQDGGTYATFVRLNGVDSSNSLIHTTTAGSSSMCTGLINDIFDVTDVVKNSTTTLEIGVIKLGSSAPANRSSIVGAMTAMVTYIDVTAPVITINNPNTTIARSKMVRANTNEGTLTMSLTTGSICDASLTFTTYSSKTFSSESDNGQKICYKAVDSSSNTTYMMSNIITGIDTTAPILNLPSNIIVDTTNPRGKIVNFEVTASDLNPVNPVVTCNQLSGSLFRIGTKTVSCDAIDMAGNIAHGSFTVTVQDVTPPPVYDATIRVCEAIIDENGDSIAGPISGILAVIWQDADYEGPAANFTFSLLPAIFTTPLSLETIFGNIQGECKEYSVDAGRYYYGQGRHGRIGNWEVPLYNDEFDAGVSDLTDFGEFNSDLNPEFNKHDGVIEVSTDQTKTLMVLNKLVSSEN